MKPIVENIVETTFLGVTIDTENGSSDPRINKALNKSYNLLDIIKFVEVTKFKLNMVMFDYFWQIVVRNTFSLNIKNDFILVKNTTIKYHNEYYKNWLHICYRK